MPLANKAPITGAASGFTVYGFDADGNDIRIPIEDIMIPPDVTPPAYKEPTSSLTSIASIKDIGSNISGLSITIGFVQEDAGQATAYRLYKNGVVISNEKVTIFSESNLQEDLVFYGEVDYDQGPIKNNNIGQPDTDGRIDSGTLTTDSQAISVVSTQKIYFGSVSTIPTTESQYKALPQNIISTVSTADLITGTTNTKFVISVPQGVSIGEVLDLDTNYRMEDEFLALPEVTITDSSGNAVVHNNYAMQNGIPYNPSTTFRITFTNA